VRVVDAVVGKARLGALDWQACGVQLDRGTRARDVVVVVVPDEDGQAIGPDRSQR
jgi:hypothetical protein